MMNQSLWLLMQDVKNTPSYLIYLDLTFLFLKDLHIMNSNYDEKAMRLP